MSENLTSQFGLGWGNGCCDENNCGGSAAAAMAASLKH